MTQIASIPAQVTPEPAPARRRPRRLRRWLPTAALVGALVTLGAGLAQALLSSSGTGTGSATTGSVGVNPFGVTSKTCTYTALSPGDLTGSDTCVLDATYQGNVAAWESLTVEIASAPGSGASPLYDGTNTNGLTFSISDGTNTFTVPTGAGTTVGCPVGETCWTAEHDLAAWYAGATPNLTFNNGDSVIWTATPLFPAGAGNAYQGATATLSLVINAVQAQGNALPGSCTTSTIGQPCPAAGPFAWS